MPSFHSLNNIKRQQPPTFCVGMSAWGCLIISLLMRSDFGDVEGFGHLDTGRFVAFFTTVHEDIVAYSDLAFRGRRRLSWIRGGSHCAQLAVADERCPSSMNREIRRFTGFDRLVLASFSFDVTTHGQASPHRNAFRLQ